ncbi:MAG: hypothetical protein JW840_02460 [Candidatus Thermoplasmatota archaeon]|nr:hypothetical protein [Candidatus Thermoplasmatota archaeon]
MTPNWDYTMIEGKGAFINRPTRTGKKLYDKFFIYVPTELARDSSFPFKTNDELKIRIDQKNRRLILEKTG